MTWLLVLYLTGPAQTVSLPVGLLINEEACNVAGLGMAVVLEKQVLDLSVNWQCAPQVAA